MNTVHRIMINGCKIRLSVYFETLDRITWRYAFTPKGANEPLFVGHDFTTPRIFNTSRKIALGLLSFLTLKPGDTDKEYFKDYTEKQLAWANSFDCELLQYYVMELEEKEDK